MRKMTRPYENTQLFIADDRRGAFDIPYIYGMDDNYPCDYIGFNYASTERHPQDKGCHFYLDDYQFVRVWNNPSQYINLLRRFKYVLSPDFSMFTDYDTALNIYSHYKKHFLAAYWQSEGVNVIPTISWADGRSFTYCFDGEPEHSVVSVSAVGASNSARKIAAFALGFDEMMKRLRPTKVIFFGKKIVDENNYECQFEFHDAFVPRR